MNIDFYVYLCDTTCYRIRVKFRPGFTRVIDRISDCPKGVLKPWRGVEPLNLFRTQQPPQPLPRPCSPTNVLLS